MFTYVNYLWLKPKASSYIAIAFFFILFCNMGLITPVYSLATHTQTKNMTYQNTVNIIPSKFLRRWDPVTFFFTFSPLKTPFPSFPHTEAYPEKYFHTLPTHPGSYTWLNSSTLQFRPAIPWQALQNISWQAINQPLHTVTVLLSMPKSTFPQEGSIIQEPITDISLQFDDNIDPEQLRKAIHIAITPYPYQGNKSPVILDHHSFSIKQLERAKADSPVNYLLQLTHPLPTASQIDIQLSLSSQPQSINTDKRLHITFQTAEPFHIKRVFCSQQHLTLIAKGSQYNAQQALSCQANENHIQIEFSRTPQRLNPLQWHELIALTPTVPSLTFTQTGNILHLKGNFQAATLYQLRLQDTLRQVFDQQHHPLSSALNQVYFFFPRLHDYLRFNTSNAIIERYGAQVIPLEGRGFQQLDLRIHPINPLDHTFWPFSSHPLSISDDNKPPAPGHLATTYSTPIIENTADDNIRIQHIKALGSPAFSQVVNLPHIPANHKAKFGLNIKNYLQKIAGENAPGSYLLGLRRLDKSAIRDWIRIQVTDLSLTTIEEPRQLIFVVSSLKTGKPVANARVKIEGYNISNKKWKSIFEHTTDQQGKIHWKIPARSSENDLHWIKRIVVQKGKDYLLLDVEKPPEKFYRNHWRKDNYKWLQWTQEDLQYRGQKDKILCHIFPERPVYHPNDTVHIKGYLRHYHQGQLTTFQPTTATLIFRLYDTKTLVWKYPIKITPQGSFYYPFKEQQLPTGEYDVTLKIDDNKCGYAEFKKEAYQLPRFEVNLDSPYKVRLDEPFEVKLHAEYYAGGMVKQQPLRWRISQYPYHWKFPQRKGFFYASDGRYSSQQTFPDTIQKEQYTYTDKQGFAKINIDPRQESTAQPRYYIVEATVTGKNQQTVSSTRKILSLPPFVVAVKVPRYLPLAKKLTAKVILVNHLNQLQAGEKITVRLLQRQWHSYLQAGNYTQGNAKYHTRSQDKVLSEKIFVSQKTVQSLDFSLPKAGVYIIEAAVTDKQGRQQTVRVDLFAGGKENVTWPVALQDTFTLSSDKKRYQPGETAQIIIQSPFKKAHILAVIEQANEKNRYQWLSVNNGSAQLSVPLTMQDMPRLAVHFLLFKGRLQAQSQMRPNHIDLDKPITLASSIWLNVSPIQHKVTVNLSYPKLAKPGESIAINIDLKDQQGKPLSGEVTLWLVDQAVLALGKEKKLNPIKDFIVQRKSYIQFHDTRNMALGYIPMQTYPGGDGSDAQGGNLLDKVSLRKNFKVVPYYNPSIQIDKSGHTQILVTLPDNLSNFKIRAKAISGQQRFGYAKGHIAIRLPLIIQAALPRFVRPGDTFTAIGLSRMLDTPSPVQIKNGSTEIALKGLHLVNPATRHQNIQWQKDKVSTISYPVSVPQDISSSTVSIKMAVERNADQSRDAFLLELPVKADREPVTIRKIYSLYAGQTVSIPAIKTAIRPNSLQRSLLLTTQPEIIQAANALDYVLEYPYGCTEQQISRARAILAMQQFLSQPQGTVKEKVLAPATQKIQQTLQYIETVVTENDLLSYWPGSKGHVALTAWGLQFMLEAKQVGYTINHDLYHLLSNSLKKALRSDFSSYSKGQHYADRIWALTALAQAQQLDYSYAMELVRYSDWLTLESLAQITWALQQNLSVENPLIQQLEDKLWKGIRLQTFQGKIHYHGLLEKNPLDDKLLPSETRTIAHLLRAITSKEKKNILLTALLQAGERKDKSLAWGNTNSNTAAIMALTELLKNSTPIKPVQVNYQQNRQSSTLSLKQLKNISDLPADDIRLHLALDTNKAVMAEIKERYIPQLPGYLIQAHNQGFVIEQNLLHIQTKGIPAIQYPVNHRAAIFSFQVGDIIEYHIRIINPKDRHHVAITVPLAAGIEYLNPQLKTYSNDAIPTHNNTITASYQQHHDDQISYFFDFMSKGSYDFYFRSKATIVGTFTQPAAKVEMMYQPSIKANSYASRITIK